MKKLTIIIMVLVISFLFVGCEWNPFVTPDPEVPVAPAVVMEANVSAVLVGCDQVAWSIENIGDVFIREYVMTFNVYYPMVELKDNVVFEVTGNYLEVGDKAEGILELVGYDIPETVSVSWVLE